jgi:phospholipid/cholesterol/gamma-HCH transport system substrate-binding protein
VARLVTVAAIAVLAVIVGVTRHSSPYVLHARFRDAGQLVAGDLVKVGGHQVGTVGAIDLSPGGLADVRLDISAPGIVPIRQGTLATIGQISLTGVANRFVGLTLGGGIPIPDRGTLPDSQTRGIVDLDTLLDSLTPQVRADVGQILSTGAYLVAQPTASSVNRLAMYLNPALSQTSGLAAQIAAGRPALARLVSGAATVVSALAPHANELAQAVTGTATALQQVASRRSALADAVERAPGVLHQGTGVLTDLRHSLGVLDPALGDLRSVAPRLAALLRAFVPAATRAIPTIAGAEALIPKAKAALLELLPVERRATPAVISLTAALGSVTPILAGARPYVPDAVAGLLVAGGSDGGGYDANGHYLRAGVTLSGSASGLLGALTLLGGVPGTVSPLTGQRVGLLSRCPGGATTPASAGGNPWTTPDAQGNLCNPADDQR